MTRIDMAMVASRASSITDQVSSVKDSFSSWDKCMQASYCKWPIIAAMVIAGLIVFSVVWCVVRCACCGLSCCCTCFSCLKCCGECCGMCSGGNGRNKDRNHKQIDDSYRPQPSQAYQPSPYTGYQAPAPMGHEKPQYAQFQVGKNGFAVDPPKSSPVHADALPAMPSWEGAANIRVLTEHQKDEGLEMGNLTPDGQNIPLMSGGVGGARTPASPRNENGSYFGGRGGPGPNGGYMQGQPEGNLPHGPGGISRTGSPAMMNGRSGPNTPGGGVDGASRGMAAMRGPGMNGRGGPAAFRGPNRGEMAAMRGPGMNGPSGGAGYGGPNRIEMAMGRGPPNQSPGALNQRPEFSPAAGYRGPPQRQYPGAYAPNGPQRQFSNTQGPSYPPSGPQRPYPDISGSSYGQNGPQRQYSDNDGPPYGHNGPQRQFSNDSGAPLRRNILQPQRQASNGPGVPYPLNAPQRQGPGNTGFPQPRQRQYSNDSSHRPLEDTHRPPVSPLSPLSGFDFGLGVSDNHVNYESPSQAQSNYALSSTALPSYTSAPQQQSRVSPPSQELDAHNARSFSPIPEMESSEPIVSRPDGTPAYPGYKPYSPAPPPEAARSTPPPAALIPGRQN